MNRYLPAFAAILLAWPAFASQGTHNTTEQLEAAIEAVVQAARDNVEVRVLEVEKEVLVEVEVVREVEVPAPSGVNGSAGFGFANAACGSGKPTFNFDYDRDSDDIPAHFRMGIGPNGSCAGQGVRVDAYVAKRKYLRGGDNLFLVAAAGYDSRTVPFEYVRTDLANASDPFKHFHGERVETIQGLAGVGWDCGDNCSIRVLWNFVDSPLLAGGNVGPVQVAATYEVFESVELNLTADDTIRTLDVSWESDGMRVTGSMTYGANDLDNGAPAAFDDGSYVQAGSPDPLYAVNFGWKVF